MPLEDADPFNSPQKLLVPTRANLLSEKLTIPSHSPSGEERETGGVRDPPRDLRSLVLPQLPIAPRTSSLCVVARWQTRRSSRASLFLTSHAELTVRVQDVRAAPPNALVGHRPIPIAPLACLVPVLAPSTEPAILGQQLLCQGESEGRKWRRRRRGCRRAPQERDRRRRHAGRHSSERRVLARWRRTRGVASGPRDTRSQECLCVVPP